MRNDVWNLVPQTAQMNIIGTVPSRPRALTKVKVNIWWDPSREPREESQQVDCLRHRQDEASPGVGVARRRLRQV